MDKAGFDKDMARLDMKSLYILPSPGLPAVKFVVVIFFIFIAHN